MPNIMITERCNFNCSYCFADEYVNKEAKDITIDQMNRILNFIKTSKRYRRIGLIGGEPTIHPQFREILTLIKNDNEIRSCSVFTNGYALDHYFDLLKDEKFVILINLNSPLDIGEERYYRVYNNVSRLIHQYEKTQGITLGINLYQKNQSVEYFINACKELRVNYARVAITVPNAKTIEKNNVSDYLDLIYYLYVELKVLGTEILIDCNKPMPCLWDELQKKKIQLFNQNFKNKLCGIPIDCSRCNTIIDILPDMTAIRCFGLSKVSKQKIDNYDTIDDLYDYYDKNFDQKLTLIPMKPECNNCGLFTEQKCYGGCLASKLGIKEA